ncbi:MULTISPECIES: Txe/YoeB family addiction module toxin [unclassified Oceanispirochaeta]|uniref:Txe/YoeB family addiction module toxin n=1 Tax=unclassified Oceanispirochaeta TaxID=2635722 RepID=UPI000E094067|nr:MULTISPECIES: Txe/YoeB family addiction module toxin [unclassified Oceanispirochaeta]MBF9016491.1 Txe/YoeB family addiction module toxin [Oceanispirochaeta sp. M2]NPD72953.1 Txe/YoeB family addiction module toxin [Oceanispirochaeta sp. M1]RDG31527.1 Txe/YoeB family addiction module toxin [Oceanispirochaeta sp. M1]
MIISFHDLSWQDYLYWQQNDRKVLRKINELIKGIQRDPFAGTGKPEPLKHNLQGCWSRRIDQEHRIVYRIRNNSIEIISCRYHY